MIASNSLDAEALDWYRTTPIADAHADSLLWNRDLCKRSTDGHVDFERLREAGVRVQIFTIPTRGWPLVDGMGAFCAWNGWPRAARRSPHARAVYQIEQLHAACARAGGAVALARTVDELDRNVAEGRLSAILGLEGAYPLEGDLSRLQTFFDLGVRTVGPAHLVPGAYSSCSFWMYRDQGVGAAGRELLSEMQRLGIALDIAHASPRAINTMLEPGVFNGAVFTSHTGMAGATRHWRNLADDDAALVAARQGMIAIILARIFLGGASLDHFARHVKHAVDLVGSDRVALGSDFDGLVRPPEGICDVTDLPKVAVALARAGLSRGAVMDVLGRSQIAFLRRALPRS